MLETQQRRHQAHLQAGSTKLRSRPSQQAPGSGQTAHPFINHRARTGFACKVRGQCSFNLCPRQALGQRSQWVLQIYHLIEVAAKKVWRARAGVGHVQIPQKLPAIELKLGSFEYRQLPCTPVFMRVVEVLQGRLGEFVTRTLNEVALPVPWHHAVLDLGRADMDDHLGDLTAPRSTPRERSSRVPRPWRTHATSWRRSSPLGKT